MKLISTILTISLLFSCAKQESATSIPEHPNLILTADGVKSMRSSLGKVPLFDQSVETAQAEVDAEIELGIDVPIPKD
ncbi:MAG: hypothetical protein RIF46_10415 [Cyclobacteriaceae bacterium]